MNLLLAIDNSLAPWLPELARIVVWGALSGAFSMAIYAWVSPQPKLAAVRADQKAIRAQLMRYDGPWPGLRQLIQTDLALSMRQIVLMLLPFLLSVSPVLWIIYTLHAIFGDTQYSHFGPEWMRGFEFWYILALIVVSLIIKYKYRLL